MEPAEYEGLWWKPYNDDDQVAGWLLYSNEEMYLDLIGSFSTAQEFLMSTFSGEGDSFPVLFGTTVKGQDVTLVDCDAIGGQYGAGASNSAHWREGRSCGRTRLGRVEPDLGVVPSRRLRT